MMTYCKAYPVERFHRSAQWPRIEAALAVHGSPAEVLFVHDTYVLTTGPSRERGVVLDVVPPDWVQFCRTQLAFAVPDFLEPHSLTRS